LRKSPATQNGYFPILVSFLLCDVQYVGRCTLPIAWSKLRKSAPSPARAHASLGRTKHQSIKRQQPNTRNPNYHSAPTHTHTLTQKKPPHTPHTKNVLPLRSGPPPALFRREDRSSRSRDRDGFQHVQPVGRIRTLTGRGVRSQMTPPD
jgi:hypothetical protein